MRLHARRDMLEAHRHLDALFAEGRRHAVEQVRRGDVAHRRALPALVLEQIVVQQHEHVVGRDIPALFVDDAQAVRVAVGGDAQVRVMIRHGALQVAQRVRIGRGQMAAEERVVAVVDHVHVTARGEEDRHQAREADAVHRVEHHARPARADGVHVDLLHDGIQVRVARVDELHAACIKRLLERHRGNVLLSQRVRLPGNRRRHILGRVAAAAGEELDAVVDGRVMAGRHGRAVGQAHVLDGEHDLRGRRGEVDKVQPHALRRHDLGKPDCALAAEEAAVIADAEALLRHALPLHAPRHRARHTADIRPGEAVADHRAPAARTKLNHAPCLLAPPFRRGPSYGLYFIKSA